MTGLAQVIRYTILSEIKYFTVLERRLISDYMTYCSFYSASALLAMQSAVLARGIMSVRPSVRLSVRHVPVLCPDE